MKKKKEELVLNDGDAFYSVATGKMNPLMKASRDAVKWISEELTNICYPTEHGTLWLFKSEYDAISAKNRMKAMGIHTGYNLGRFVVKDGILTCDDEWTQSHAR